MLSGSISASISKFHPHGNPEEILLGNGVKETWTYNKRLQVQGISTTKAAVNLLGITYEYGLSDAVNNGNVTKQTIVPPGAANFVQEYLYDDLNRLKYVSETTTVPGASGWSRAFHYDRYGNLGMDSAAALNQYNAGNNRIEKDASGNALSPYPYDAMGNIVNHPTLGQMKFDQAGRLRETVVLGKTVTYDYDGEGRRVKRNYSGLGTTYYVYDGEGQLAAEYGVSDPMLCTVCYITSDALGSTRLMTDGTGTVKQRTDHLPFGDVIPANNTNGGRQSITDGQAQTTYTLAGGPTQKFTGKERDAETGLDYFGARYMSAAQGRFTSPDPLLESGNPKNPQSWNRYAYAFNNPLRFVDPNGLCSAPAVNPGETGVCIDLYIAAPRINGIGHGDNRGPAPNNPSATYRQEIQLAINPSDASVRVVKDDPGVSKATVLRIPESPAELMIGRKGESTTTVSPVTTDKDGTGHFAVYNEAVNGLSALPGAPKDTIKTDLKFTFTPDGRVGLDPGGTRTAYPSLEIYRYDAQGRPSTILQVQERNPRDLCCRNQVIPKVVPR